MGIEVMRRQLDKNIKVLMNFLAGRCFEKQEMCRFEAAGGYWSSSSSDKNFLPVCALYLLRGC